MKYSEISKPILEYFVESFEYCDRSYAATAKYCGITPAMVKKILDHNCDSKMNFRTQAAVLKSYRANG